MNVRFNPTNSGNKSKFVKKGSDSSTVCDHCKLTGHSKDKCFVLHGYPEWDLLHGQPKPKLRTNASKHTNSNVNASSPAVQLNANATTSQTSSTARVDLSEQQYQKMLDMFQSRLKNSTESSANNAPWIHANNVSQMAGLLYQPSANSIHLSTPVSSWIIDS